MNVANRKAIARLSARSLRADKKRNLVAICAIVLTATLFTALFAVGGGVMNAMQEATMRMVGTSAHGGFKFLTQQQYDIVAADEKVRDISYNIILGVAENEELAKTYTEIRYTEEKSARWGFSMPTTGTLPVEKYDLATDTAVLDALGVAHRLGESVELTYTARGVRHTQRFTLCGFWEGDVALGAHEAFVSRAYSDEAVPVATVPPYESGDLSFAGTINPALWFSSSWDIEGQMEALKERCGFDSRVNEGVNWAYAGESVDYTTLVLVAMMLLLILGSCYLIIYNVFQISVSRDIRFYGLLKTIGTTPRQLRRLVRRQAYSLCLAGIPLGLGLGFLVGWVLMPVILSSTTISGEYRPASSPLIFLSAALFALLTVRLSCIRPCRLAGRVSPVEAVRYTGVDGGKQKTAGTHRVTPLRMAAANLRRDGKKAAVVVLSLSLSLVLLNATASIVRGFDGEKYLRERAATDFFIKDNSLVNTWTSAFILDGVDPDTVREIGALPGLERTGCVWSSLGEHTLSDSAYERTEKILDEYAEEFQNPYATEILRKLEQERKISQFVSGMDECLWDEMEMAGGAKLDYEKFRSGEYVVVTAWDSEGKEPYYLPGERVTVDFGNGNRKSYTVLAAGDIPYALSESFSGYMDIRFTLPAEEYLRQVGERGAMVVAFDVDEEHTAATEEWCEGYTEQVKPQLAYVSRSTLMEAFSRNQRMFGVVGGALSAILALIGILNFTNAIITSVDSRRRELAVLQSIGMTGGQMKKMLRGEGLLYMAATLAVALTFGSGIAYVLVKLLTRELWYFTWHFSAMPLLYSAPFLLLSSILVPSLSYRAMSRYTVTERLRTAE